jgi:hypothetical protein
MLTDSQKINVVNAIYSQAKNQPEKAWIAIAFVIKNRLQDYRWKDDIDKTINELVVETASPKEYLYQMMKEVVVRVWIGNIEDPTKGSIWFVNKFKAIGEAWPNLVSESKGKQVQINDLLFTGTIQPEGVTKKEEPEKVLVKKGRSKKSKS